MQPTRPDEVTFLRALIANGNFAGDNAERRPYELAEELGIPAKRAEYLYEKWDRRGWYGSGVTTRTGWLYREKLPEIEKFLEKYP